MLIESGGPDIVEALSIDDRVFRPVTNGFSSMDLDLQEDDVIAVCFTCGCMDMDLNKWSELVECLRLSWFPKDKDIVESIRCSFVVI